MIRLFLARLSAMSRPRRLIALGATWGAMSAAEKRRFLAHIQGEGLPKGCLVVTPAAAPTAGPQGAAEAHQRAKATWLEAQKRALQADRQQARDLAAGGSQ